VGKPDARGRACSFCGCTDPHRRMVNGPGVRICGECVALAGEIVTVGQDQAAGGTVPGARLLG